MKTSYGILITTLTLLISSIGFAQKVQSFTIERTIQASADKVWKVVGEEFADIAKSHPKLSGSHYVEGSPLSGEGCERVCSLNANGSKYTQEKMVDYNPTEFSFKAEIKGVGGLPIDTTTSYMIYDVDPIDENTCKITLTMVYRTNPAFMGGLAKGKFRKNIEDYAIAIEHYTLTGEDVNPENFKRIKKQYS
ncbi:SRPBCC family protein [bacterium SCSIO 12741]|nr:SRPBCC family protein [bacterium SCSIO 12741]